MKINRVGPEKETGNSAKGSFFTNLYYFLKLYRYIAILILGFAIAAFMVLLVLDFTIPDELEKADMKTTLALFDQLQEDNRHEEAIVLMEYKGNLMKDRPEELEYKIKLSDSYIRVGDYSKAEKMLLDVWQNAPKYLSQDSVDKNISDFLKFSIARIIYQFYEKIGDTKNQVKFFNIYKSSYKTCDVDLLKLGVSKINDKSWWGVDIDMLNVDELIEYDSIVVLSLTEKNKASEAMMAYVDRILPLPMYGVAYKMKCLNKLIGWSLERGDLAEAYSRINQAVDLAKILKPVDQNEVLGDLSDYCFTIHDVELSKTLYLKYQDYLDDNYKKTDDEYLKNKARSFRYLESEGKWEELIKNLTAYCEGLRTQITRNIPTMTEEQREFFAEQFERPYNYALTLLQSQPDDRLANLCFDNITFKNGLLLRSNISIENSIRQLGDSSVMEKYEQLKSCRRELIYQSVVGKHLFSKAGALEEKISALEKELALACTDFKTKNDIEEMGYEQIQKHMKAGEAVVAFVENESKLFALAMVKNNPVKYIPLCNLSQITSKLHRPVYEIYHDETLTDSIWNKVEKELRSCHDIYYIPIGVFTQVSLGTLYLGNNKYLCDVKNIRLLSNPVDFIAEKELRLQGGNVQKPLVASLWGGIDYGPGTAGPSNLSHTRSAIKRGDNLVSLRYAQQEVSDISAMLNSKNIVNTVYSGSQASETAFKKRSGKGDYIVHISTHGFFNDSGEMRQSMLESGLFFAGANKYWSNDTIECEPGQEDGILRAAEISNLNLSGCSLVVLSACETGLGFSDTSEGVYGLQRAFKLAGAKQILMSLWDVDDRATNILMTEFYKNLLNGKTTDEALDNSRKVVRQQYPSPEDWGAFVLLH